MTDRYEFRLWAAIGPHVIYHESVTAEELDAASPAGWAVDYETSHVKIRDGHWFSAPLTDGSDDAEVRHPSKVESAAQLTRTIVPARMMLEHNGKHYTVRLRVNEHGSDPDLPLEVTVILDEASATSHNIPETPLELCARRALSLLLGEPLEHYGKPKVDA